MAWVCPLCSTANEEGSTECMVCGEERVLAEETPRVATSGWGAALARATEDATPTRARTTGSWSAALSGASGEEKAPTRGSWGAALAGASGGAKAPTAGSWGAALAGASGEGRTSAGSRSEATEEVGTAAPKSPSSASSFAAKLARLLGSSGDD